MFKLEFSIKQHTPLIHFQGNQENATLRSTEVKPKLDKFIEKFIDVTSDPAYVTWYKTTNVGISFNYKLRINPEGTISNKLINENDVVHFFFGHMGEEYINNKKYLSYTNQKINITIISLCSDKVNNESLLELIASIIPQFFLLHNFGTRQTKAYGSFYLDVDDPLYIDPIDLNSELADEMQGFYCPIASNKPTNQEKVKEIHEKLELFYKALRSGINKCFGQPKYYIKSLLWLYFKKQNPNLKWEKRKIKEVFFNAILHTQMATYSESDTNTPLFANGPSELAIKDLLGLSSIESWRIPYHATISKSISDVDRFTSPIIFKILHLTNNNFVIFIHINESQSEQSLLNKRIQINERLTMNLPDSFSYQDFLDFIFQINLEQHFFVSTNNGNTPVSELEQNEVPAHFRTINYFLENFRR